MPWSAAVPCFFGGLFLANFFPHFIAGMSGTRFHTPFAKPPFRGLSPPAVNVLWGAFNLAVGYALLFVVGSFELRRAAHAAIAAAGFVLASIGIARSLGRLRRLST